MRILALTPLLVLAACGSGSTPAAVPTAGKTGAASDGGYVAKVKALAPKQRAGVLLRAIRDADRPCQGVVAEQAVASASGTAWLATCDDQGHWVVAIADDGTATVANAQDLAGGR